MSDIVDKARTARTNLAQALSLLQTPEAGSLVDSVAEPVARAMGALHQLESSAGSGVTSKAPLARDAVREALATLQTTAATPTSEKVTEIIAGSLGLLHGLAQLPEPITEKQKVAFDKTQLPTDMAKRPSTVPPAAAARVPSVRPAPAAPSGALDMTMPTGSQSPIRGPSPDFASTKASAGMVAQAKKPSPQQQKISIPPPEERRDSKHASLPPEAAAEEAITAEANLGAHSPTNFYKGLSGNDVVDDGGLFVSTYEIPPLGATLQLTVNMPGGYDFRALAVVKWTRESGVGDAPPGFGCAFTSISQEARQLIYRYVRNREPLFHDDF